MRPLSKTGLPVFDLLKVGDILLDDIQQLAGADHRFHRTDVGPDLTVDLIESDLLAHVLIESLMQRGHALAVGVQAAADVDGLAGGHQLVGEDVLRVLQDPMPLYRRIPKRGFTNRNRLEIVAINVSALERFDAGSEVSVETLIESGIVKNPKDGVKILGNGELTKKLTVKANAFSASAKEKIEAVGGTCEVI